MGNVFERVIAILIVVVMLFVAPILDQFKSMDTLSYNIVYDETKEFVDKCAAQGQVTKALYNDFVTSISNYGSYKVRIEHQEKTWVPDPADPALYNEVFISTFDDEIIDDYLQNNALPTAEQIYNMNINDYFVVEVIRTSNNYYESYKRGLVDSDASATKYVRMGGLVKNEHN